MQTLQTSRKDRLERIKATFIIRRQEDAQLKQPDDRLVVARCISIEKHLTNLGVDPNSYDTVYEYAVQIHNEQGAKGPFGIDQIIQGAIKLKSKQTPVNVFTKELKQKEDCDACNGTGLQFNNGKILYEIQEGKKKAVKCTECNG